MIKGVVSVMPGYAGGKVANPTYEQVSSGTTGHAEVTEVVYDPALVRFEDLLTVFFGSHDPTTLNRQGADVGTQYRSVVFCETPEDIEATTDFISSVNSSSAHGNVVVTEVLPMADFYPAEEFHRDYAARNPQNPYCEVVINPKLQKVQEHFAGLLTRLS